MVALIYTLAHMQRPDPQPPPLRQTGTLQQGTGPIAAKDARITVHFSAKTDDGAVVADTESRGMAFTFLMEQDTVEAFWHETVRGMRQGGVKAVRVRASSVGLAMQGDPFLTVTVRVVRVAPL